MYSLGVSLGETVCAKMKLILRLSVCAWNMAVLAPDGMLPLKNMFSIMLRQKQKWEKCNFFCSNSLKNMHQILLYGAFSTDGMFSPCGGNGGRTLALCLVATSHKRSWITSRSCESEIALKQAPHISKPTKTPSPTWNGSPVLQRRSGADSASAWEIWLAWKWFNHATTHCSSWPTPSGTTRTHLSFH